jgi:hypothetical protein
VTRLRDQSGAHRYRYGVRRRLSGQLQPKVRRLCSHRFGRRASLVCDHASREAVRVEAQDHPFYLRQIKVAEGYACRRALGCHAV